MSLITRAEFKTYLGITTTDDDDLIDGLLLSAQKFIEQETHKIFDASTITTRYFTWGDDTNDDSLILYLDHDLAEVSTITNGDGTTVSSSAYNLWPLNRVPYREIRLLPSSGIAWTFDTDPDAAISVAGYWGWSKTADDQIKQLAKRVTGFFYRQKDAQAYDLAGFSELGTIRVKHQMPLDILQMLTYYQELV